MGDVKEYALAYAQRGWKVIPLYGIGEDGNCTCRLGSECGSPGKHPFWRDWPNKASDDPEQIAHWFDQGDYNIGIDVHRSGHCGGGSHTSGYGKSVCDMERHRH